MKRTNKVKIGFATLAMLGLFSCDSIPSAYQGTFIDPTSGTKIVLDGSSGTLVNPDGSSLKTDTDDKADFDSINSGKPGVYLVKVADNQNLLDVRWLVPDAKSRQESNGFASMNAEIIYTRMAKDQEQPVQELQFEHCKDGKIELDLVQKTWTGGCPANAVVLDGKRAKGT